MEKLLFGLTINQVLENCQRIIKEYGKDSYVHYYGLTSQETDKIIFVNFKTT